MLRLDGGLFVEHKVNADGRCHLQCAIADVSLFYSATMIGCAEGTSMMTRFYFVGSGFWMNGSFGC